MARTTTSTPVRSTKTTRNANTNNTKEAPVASNNIVSVKMSHIRDTKGTHVFAAVDPEAAITTLYVRKGAHMKDGAPEKITITVTVG